MCAHHMLATYSNSITSTSMFWSKIQQILPTRSSTNIQITRKLKIFTSLLWTWPDGGSHIPFVLSFWILSCMDWLIILSWNVKSKMHVKIDNKEERRKPLWPMDYILVYVSFFIRVKFYFSSLIVVKFFNKKKQISPTFDKWMRNWFPLVVRSLT